MSELYISNYLKNNQSINRIGDTSSYKITIKPPTSPIELDIDTNSLTEGDVLVNLRDQSNYVCVTKYASINLSTFKFRYISHLDRLKEQYRVASTNTHVSFSSSSN